jgi:alkanesulfonate monooxygenase SsuD/methylene tetrahydromethanopterin reductase-like flavin-dependent oxidoreductase (luciferase family)
MNTGHPTEGFPSAGAWLSYALGSENENLPTYVAITDIRGEPPNGKANWSNGFLPARHQGIMMSDLSPTLVAPAVDAVRGHLREFGRDDVDFRFNNFMAWYVYDDLAEARHEAKRWIGFRAIFREYMMREFMSEEDFATILEFIPQIYAMAAADADSVAGLPDRLLDDCVDHLTLTGSTDDMDHVIEHLLELKAAGCNEVAIELKKHQAHGIELIGERVIPALR